MYNTVDEKPIQKKTQEKPTHKRPSWSLLVLFPTILLILILGATMGTVLGFKNQLKSFEDRIALLEKPMTLKTNHNENNLDGLQKKTAEERPGNEPSRRVDVPKKTAKKRYYAESSRLVKVSQKTPKEQYRTARSGDKLNSISAPL